MKERFFMLAKKLASHSDHSQHHLGAAIVSGNKVIGVGFNKNKTHPKSFHKFKGIHAEFSAVMNSREQNVRGASIYVYRETKNGTLGNSKPCIFCQDMLRSVYIKNVYYTTENGYEHMELI